MVLHYITVILCLIENKSFNPSVTVTRMWVYNHGKNNTIFLRKTYLEEFFAKFHHESIRFWFVFIIEGIEVELAFLVKERNEDQIK